MTADATHTRNEAIGAALGLLTASTSSGFLICFREAAQRESRPVIVFCMLFWAALLNSFVVVGRVRKTPKPSRLWVRSAVILSTMTIAGNIGVAVALPELGAGVTSCVLQLQVFMVAGAAWLFLGERVSVSLLVGACLAVVGFASFALPSEGLQLSASGLLAAMVGGASFGGMIVYTRAVISKVDPTSLNAGRLWIAVAAMGAWPGIVAGASGASLEVWLLTAGAAFGGPFVGRLAIMYSLRYISAARTKLWSMLAPAFAFAFVYLLYGTVPTGRELLGGGLIVLGVLLPRLW